MYYQTLIDHQSTLSLPGVRDTSDDISCSIAGGVSAEVLHRQSGKSWTVEKNILDDSTLPSFIQLWQFIYTKYVPSPYVDLLDSVYPEHL